MHSCSGDSPRLSFGVMPSSVSHVGMIHQHYTRNHISAETNKGKTFFEAINNCLFVPIGPLKKRSHLFKQGQKTQNPFFKKPSWFVHAKYSIELRHLISVCYQRACTVVHTVRMDLLSYM